MGLARVAKRAADETIVEETVSVPGVNEEALQREYYEILMKRHQMRYNLRMHAIEVLEYRQIAKEDAKAFSSPRIDSSCSCVLADSMKGNISRSTGPFSIFLPHWVSVIAGKVLFLSRVNGSLGKMTW
jgi:hypothetical protein